MTTVKPHGDRLRVAVLVEGLTVDAWIAETIRQVTELANVELCLVIVNAVPDRSAGLLQRLWRSRSHLVYRGYSILDRRLFGSLPDAFAATDLSQLLEHIPQRTVEPRQSKYSDSFDQSHVESLPDQQIDVCLNFCHRIQRGAILGIARFGVWSYHHGDASVYRGGPPGFWEVMNQDPVTGSTLQVLSEELDGGLVLARSWSATDETSVNRNCNSMFWKTTRLMPRALSRLASCGSLDEISVATPEIYSGPLFRPPKTINALRSIGAHCLRAVRRKFVNKLKHEQWQILFQPGGGLPESMHRMKRLIPPADRLWADPFILEAEGRVWLFVEELIYRNQRAHISAMEYDPETQSFGPPEPVLVCDYHLSYPNVFEYDGQYWMIPESSENRQVELYTTDELPGPWKLHSVLMENTNAVDATLYQKDGRWWMFCGIAEVDGGTTWDESFLFSTEDFRQPDWEPHPVSPIVSDARRARPAGSVFMHNGMPVRPSQDCSRQYGYGLRLNEITELSSSSYQEREIGYVTPDWSPDVYGVHHICVHDTVTVMDVSCRCSRLKSRLAGAGNE